MIRGYVHEVVICCGAAMMCPTFVGLLCRMGIGKTRPNGESPEKVLARPIA